MKPLLEGLNLGNLPHLDNAACSGRADWFEVNPTDPSPLLRAKQERALNVCARCPALDKCRQVTVPDPVALVFAQGGVPMFDIETQERRRRRDAAAKKRRLSDGRAAAEAARVRDEAKALLELWRGSPW